MFTSRAELLDKEETTAEHTQSHKEESDRLDKDKSNPDPYRGGLFGGLFKPKPPPLKPIVDVDDGVARCPVCSWELAEDHSCQSCGWLYQPESEGSDLTDTDFTESDEYDSALEDEDGEDDFGEIDDDRGMFDHPFQYLDGLPLPHMWGGHSMHHHHPPIFYHGVHAPYPRLEPAGALHTDDYDEEEEEDEEDEYNEMDSFIDDGEPEDGEHYDSDHGTVVDATRGPNQFSSRGPSARLPPYVPTDSEGEEDSVGTEEPGLPRGRRDSWRSLSFRESTPSSQPYISSYPQETSMAEEGESEEDEEEEEAEDDDTDTDDPYVGFHRPRYYQTASRLAANDGTAAADSSSPPRPMRSARSTGATAHNAITIDDSDEDQPVGPMRRTAQRRQARFSPY